MRDNDSSNSGASLPSDELQGPGDAAQVALGTDGMPGTTNSPNLFTSAPPGTLKAYLLMLRKSALESPAWGQFEFEASDFLASLSEHGVEWSKAQLRARRNWLHDGGFIVQPSKEDRQKAGQRRIPFTIVVPELGSQQACFSAAVLDWALQAARKWMKFAEERVAHSRVSTQCAQLMAALESAHQDVRDWSRATSQPSSPRSKNDA